MALVASERVLVHNDGTPCAGDRCAWAGSGGHGSLSAYRVESPSWRTNDPQVWHDGWRNRDRLLLFAGKCETCGRRTYAFTDGENDPRGVLGDHAASPLHAEDYDMVGPDVPQCFMCGNEEGSYRTGLYLGTHGRWSGKEGDES